MYLYNNDDQQLVEQRVEQYRDQTNRFLAGTLPEDEFLALRLMNGLYIQRQAAYAQSGNSLWFDVV